MALDKQFLKYKLEKIKNDRIWKDQDAETKRRIRKDNAKMAQEEADAIHSYLTGEDPIDAFDNKSFLEHNLPGNLFITDKGQLNVFQVEGAGTKKSRLMSLLRKHRSFGGANQDTRKKFRIIKRIFDSLNIIFKRDRISIKGDLEIEGDLLFKTGNVNGDLSVEGILNVGILNVGESSATENGYTYLPNGIILQWGTGISSSDDEEYFDFPVAFPNECFNVVTQRTNGDAQDILPVQNITATNFEINRNSDIDGSEGFYYQAIGH
jgi:hypothetical protein